MAQKRVFSLQSFMTANIHKYQNQNSTKPEKQNSQKQTHNRIKRPETQHKKSKSKNKPHNIYTHMNSDNYNLLPILAFVISSVVVC